MSPPRSQRPTGLAPRSPRRVGGPLPPAQRRSADAIVLAIYLAAFAIPGVGSTLVWIGAASWSGDRGLARHLVRHLVRALRIQAACLAGMFLVQAGVVAVLWAGFPWVGPPGLRLSLELAGLHLTAGLFLTMGLLGPILALAETRRGDGPRTPLPAASRRTPPTSSPGTPTRPPAVARRMAAAG